MTCMPVSVIAHPYAQHPEFAASVGIWLIVGNLFFIIGLIMMLFSEVKAVVRPCLSVPMCCELCACLSLSATFDISVHKSPLTIFYQPSLYTRPTRTTRVRTRAHAHTHTFS